MRSQCSQKTPWITFHFMCMTIPYNVSVLTWTEVWAEKKYHFSDHPQNQNQITKDWKFSYTVLGWILLSELKSWIINRILRSLAVSCPDCSNYLLLQCQSTHTTPPNFNLPKLYHFPAGRRSMVSQINLNYDSRPTIQLQSNPWALSLICITPHKYTILN